jgi:sterol desaturase/sphingolipid hydroxylase (fatty acid hydroxylase superfamily)
MTLPLVPIITGLIGLMLIAAFVLGLAHSISTGFAGFWGGLPFTIITVGVLAMVAYDYWDQCWRRKR